MGAVVTYILMTVIALCAYKITFTCYLSEVNKGQRYKYEIYLCGLRMELYSEFIYTDLSDLLLAKFIVKDRKFYFFSYQGVKYTVSDGKLSTLVIVRNKNPDAKSRFMKLREYAESVKSKFSKKGKAEEKEELDKFLNTVDSALQKQKPEKLRFEGDGCDREGNIIFDAWICPCCETRYKVDYGKYDYCPNCGQAIDWRDG